MTPSSTRWPAVRAVPIRRSPTGLRNLRPSKRRSSYCTSSFYYLFVSFDFCCRGAKSDYNVVVGRAREIAGPYVDAAGKPMLEGGGTRLTQGTSLWRGPGHEGILLQPGGPDLMVFHAYDGSTGRPALHISTIVWENGWPRVAGLPGDPL